MPSVPPAGILPAETVVVSGGISNTSQCTQGIGVASRSSTIGQAFRLRGKVSKLQGRADIFSHAGIWLENDGAIRKSRTGYEHRDSFHLMGFRKEELNRRIGYKNSETMAYMQYC